MTSCPPRTCEPRECSPKDTCYLVESEGVSHAHGVAMVCPNVCSGAVIDTATTGHVIVLEGDVDKEFYLGLPSSGAVQCWPKCTSECSPCQTSSSRTQCQATCEGSCHKACQESLSVCTMMTTMTASVGHQVMVDNRACGLVRVKSADKHFNGLEKDFYVRPGKCCLFTFTPYGWSASHMA